VSGLEPSRPRVADTLIVGALALALTVALIAYSEAGFHAAVAGLRLFFDVVLPSLLPFFILSEVLLALGVVHFLGELFEPIMRPVFNVPGVGSFVFSMGLAAGYPMDAVLTARLRRDGLCTRIEGERLLAFTNTADPLFIFGAVAVGMFHMPELGAALAVGHYLGSLSVGLLFRFHGVKGEGRVGSAWRGAAARPRLPRPLAARAVQAAIAARDQDGRPLVKVLNDAIVGAARTLLTIAAFIVLFAVTLRMLQVTGADRMLAVPVRAVLSLFGLPAALTHAAVSGLFEIDLGAAAAAAAHAPLVAKLVVCGAIIAWSGLSVHAQVLSVLAGTDIRLGPYYVARLLHAVLAGAFTWLALGPGSGVVGAVLAAVGRAVPAMTMTNGLPVGADLLPALSYGAFAAAACLAGLVVLGVLVAGLSGISRCRVLVMRVR
jgi:sporulation integral membrane protein YlbJ